MGFKKFHDFNNALLKKKAWRMHSCPDLLISKIFRARYFPRSTFLDAVMGSNPNYVWRSILVAQDLIRKGSLKSIGDGRSSIVFNDPWLFDHNQP